MPPARPPDPHPDISWWGWGDPAAVPELPDGLIALLAEGLGVRGGPGHPASLSELRLPPSRLDAARFEPVLGSQYARADDEARIRHTRGKSTPDLLRLRAGDLSDAPDLVLSPGSHEEVLELLRICSERRI